MKKLEFIRTPIPFFQIMTGGGFRFSTLIELWGAPKAGKSTFCYQCAASFLEDYGDKAELKIIDSESSWDEVRMKFTFGLDSEDKRIEKIGVFYVEQGMKTIEDWIYALPKDKYLMVIWDTLSTCPTKSSYESTRKAKTFDDLTMYSGGQGDRPKTIKYYSRGVMSAIYNKNVCIFFPSQVFSAISQYGPKEQSGDGSAFHHNTQYSLHFTRWSDSKVEKELNFDTDSEDHISSFTVSNVSLTKSKFSPEFSDSPIFINNQLGGVIDSRKSMFLHARITDEIIKHKAYYYHKYVINPETKKREHDPSVTGKHWEDLVDDDEIYNQLTSKILLETRKKFPVIDQTYLEQGYPKLDNYYSEDEIKKRNEDMEKGNMKRKFDLGAFLSIKPKIIKETDKDINDGSLNKKSSKKEKTEL